VRECGVSGYDLDLYDPYLVWNGVRFVNVSTCIQEATDKRLTECSVSSSCGTSSSDASTTYGEQGEHEEQKKDRGWDGACIPTTARRSITASITNGRASTVRDKTDSPRLPVVLIRLPWRV
jgi:hypothetical protein